MTLILGISDPKLNRAIVCADSGVFCQQMKAVNTDPKIFRRELFGKGCMVVALCGATWKKNAAMKVSAVNIEERRNLTPDEFTVGVLEAIAARERIIRDVDAEKPGDWGLVIALETGVYDCGADGGLASPEHGVVAIGTGGDFAHGAAVAMLGAGRTPLVAAMNAMVYGRKYTTACHGPIHWIATDGESGIWE